LTATARSAMRQLTAKLGQTASAAVIFSIGGLLGGLVFGVVKSQILRTDEFTQIVCAVQWGVTGFFAALALVALRPFFVLDDRGISTRTMMVLVAVTSGLSWFFTQIFFRLIGYDGF
jgi:hypothetical protein